MSGLEVEARLDDRSVDVTFDVPRGQVLALLGANGSGKSTSLSVVSGLLRPDAGRVRLGERTLLDVARGIDVAPHRRGTATLRQNPLLFPHLTVADNVAFAPRAAGLGRREARGRAMHWLGAVDASGLARRRPAELSGGQAQRVALARALAARPELLLLDEPFAALDVATAPDLRRLVRAVLRQQGRTAVVVTHDVLDVVGLADRVCVLAEGRVVEVGTTRDVVAAPRSAFAARLAGVNLLMGRSRGAGRLALEGGPEIAGRDAGGLAPAAPGVAIFPPSAVALHLALPSGGPRNALPGVVLDAAETGGAVRVRVALEPGRDHVVAADVTPAAFADLPLDPGAAVIAVVEAAEVALHPGRRE